MVLADHVDHRARQVVADGQLDAVRHVLPDDRGRDARVLLVVGIAAVSLVLREIRGVGGLADVVEERAGAREERVGADRVARVLGELGDDEGMVVGARGLELHPPQERVVEVGELEERDVRRALEERLEDRQEARRPRRRSGGPVRSPAAICQHEGLVRRLLRHADQRRERGDGQAAHAGRPHDAAAPARVRGSRRSPPSTRGT